MQTRTIDRILDELKPDMRVFVPGMSGESLALYGALLKRPEVASGVTFMGPLFPGINRSDYVGLHPEARQRGWFMMPSLRGPMAEGRVELVPADYPEIFRELIADDRIDIVFAQVSSPDENGQCSLGVSSDFVPAVWRNAGKRIAHINSNLPRTRGSFAINVSDIDLAFEQESPILQFDGGAPNEAMKKHAALVAGLVRDGDTLEFGVGKLQAGILDSLKSHRNLRVWSGMISQPILPLLDAGVIDGENAVNAGVALGDDALYQRCASDERIFFRPVSETHDACRIGSIPNFCAINSAVEVDLCGQVNVDSLNGKLLAGVGGLPAFASGALRSEGGRSIIALPSATDDGRFSRIVAKLGGSALCGIPRYGADYVVTENGVAELRGRSLQQRARALIEVASPQFKEQLERDWSGIASKF